MNENHGKEGEALQEMEEATLRLCHIERPSTGSCGFHLSRTAWDPYPWVSGVECGSAADLAGLQPGDCVLEVNGEDVLGQRIGQVASRVRSRDDKVTLLLWNAGSDPHSAATNISGSGPTPLSLQRLSSCLQSVLQLLECPVCLETIPPPAFQCCHGHVLCERCRAKSIKCPVCRVGLGPKGRCLLADKLHGLLTSVFSQSHKKKLLHGRHRKTSNQHIQQPFLFKSRIAVPVNSILIQPKTSSEEDISFDPQHIQQTSQPKSRIIIENSSSNGDAQLRIDHEEAENTPVQQDSNSIAVQPKACSEENISFDAASSEQATQEVELSFHCPHQSRTSGHCSKISAGSQALLKHLREDHQGPLIQYFVKPSRPVIKLRLPLSSKKLPPSSLTSFTTEDGTVLFVQVDVGASPGQRLVWLWLLGDASQSDRYRLRLSLPEGDTHAGPVFPLTSSWEEVVGSNCCLSIEESRYNRANPEVRVEILDMTVNRDT